mmetsp:Transcript_60483/g.72719  ORF Transcript_60483/g.72719 Transcript_60483/m.72719 type:complete len:556 (+) Transcript_60483:56-1723(+)
MKPTNVRSRRRNERVFSSSATIIVFQVTFVQCCLTICFILIVSIHGLKHDGQMDGELEQHIREPALPFILQNSSQFPSYSSQKQARIVGGTPLTPHRHPYLAVIYRQFPSGSLSLSCGGTLIAPNLILTAGHCASQSDLIRLGLYNLENFNDADNDVVETHTIKQKYVHPKFEVETLKYDYAIFVLDRDSKLQPVGMNTYDQIPVSDEKLWVMGWGTQSYGGRYSTLPRGGFVNYMDPNVCVPRFPKQTILEPTMMCAHSSGGAVDACQGDSGGPLIKLGPYKNSPIGDVVIAVTSWGYGCADAYYPGVYSRLSVEEIQEWIVGVGCSVRKSYCQGVFVRTKRPSTPKPTRKPTKKPSAPPTVVPTNVPTVSPTKVPIRTPTLHPTNVPTVRPTIYNPPTNAPTVLIATPTSHPTNAPTASPQTQTPTDPLPFDRISDYSPLVRNYQRTDVNTSRESANASDAASDAAGVAAARRPHSSDNRNRVPITESLLSLLTKSTNIQDFVKQERSWGCVDSWDDVDDSSDVKDERNCDRVRRTNACDEWGEHCRRTCDLC